MASSGRIDTLTSIPLPADVDPRFTLKRWVGRLSYPKNGNALTPTPTYVWELHLDGRLVDSSAKKRDMVQAAREWVF